MANKSMDHVTLEVLLCFMFVYVQFLSCLDDGFSGLEPSLIRSFRATLIFEQRSRIFYDNFLLKICECFCFLLAIPNESWCSLFPVLCHTVKSVI